MSFAPEIADIGRLMAEVKAVSVDLLREAAGYCDELASLYETDTECEDGYPIAVGPVPSARADRHRARAAELRARADSMDQPPEEEDERA